MKVKDIIYLVISGLIFMAIGVWALATFGSKPSAEQSLVEVVTPIASSFDENALKIVSDKTRVHDFVLPIDLKDIGNPTPFGGR